jgi:hypothetical protein
MNYQELQIIEDNIHSYFKTTCEPFDHLEWDGQVLQVWLDNEVIETYFLDDLGLL